MTRNQVHLNRVTFAVITQPNVRAQNLRAGEIDVAEQVAPPDASTIKSGADTSLLAVPSLAYQGITINVSNSHGAGKKPFTANSSALAQHPQLRQAFSLALNRSIINRVVFNGLYTAGCTPIPPKSPYYPSDLKCPAYDPAKAKKLIAASGVSTPVPVTLTIKAADAQSSKLGQVIQSMAGQAGFKVTLKPTEFTTALADARSGQFETFQLGWSGRVDPDQNIAPFWLPSSTLNYSGAHYPEIIKMIRAEQTATVEAQRKKLFAGLAHQFLQHNNIIYLFHPKYLLGVRKNLTGIEYFPDQLIRLKHARLSGS